MARRSRGVFDRPALAARARRDVFAIDDDRPAERFREGGHAEPLVAVGRGAKLMVEVRDAGEAQLAGRGELAQQMRERDGVGTARQRDDDARVAPREIVLANRLPDAVEQLHG